eukprot:CAMPEP_0181348054 /NCGR_PEP_ID=MMETSP1101-20121128/34203_1 /TAXON_ID=46948 /ORGANISM="Rhodomonas abbreviata, Strain Caron Lab Isolate" /LENGTH=607 /DNA_ID=CAMNT_0023460301 /DNA_START=157 /DNA_END=1980 /DNA_ORIENTATION=+
MRALSTLSLATLLGSVQFVHAAHSTFDPSALSTARLSASRFEHRRNQKYLSSIAPLGPLRSNLALRGGSVPELKSRVKLTIECSGLEYSDWKTWPFSKADPLVVVYLHGPNGSMTEVGRTECVTDNPNPTFATKVEVDYFFETRQQLQFVVVQGGQGTADPPAELGRLQCTLSSIVGSRAGKLTRKLEASPSGKKAKGRLTVLAEEVKGKRGDVLKLELKGLDLRQMDGFFAKSDPYLLFFRKRPDKSLEQVHRTETVTQNLNPTWKTVKVPLSDLCNGDLKAKWKVECWDADLLTADDEIGGVETTVEEILTKPTLPLIDREGRESLKCGSLIVTSSAVERVPSFLDYVVSGCEVTVSVAIDFTASNQDAHLPTSLHSRTGPNQYAQAMQAVGEILIEYDHDKKIAAFGYGAILPGEAEPSHCFPLTGNHAAVEVDGVQGLLDAYEKTAASVRLHGPTNFAPSIERAAMLARESAKHAYQVLLIVTDGCITDKSATVDAIVKASHLPLSIIIVGVGGEDFSDMNFLDGDKNALVDGDGNVALRDIVQFVPFRECKGDPAALASQVLRELPGQLLQYHALKGIKPHSWADSAVPLDLPADNAWAFAA